MEAEEREARAIADETNKAFSNLLKLKAAAAAAAEKEKEAKVCSIKCLRSTVNANIISFL